MCGNIYSIVIASVSWYDSKSPQGNVASMKLCKIVGSNGLEISAADFKKLLPNTYGLCVWTKVACIVSVLIDCIVWKRVYQ